MKPISRYLVTGAIVLAAIAAFIYQWRDYRENPWTRDGQVQANVIQIAPRVSGPIVTLPIRDNQLVRAGDLLMEIDPRTYQASLDQAKAQLDQAGGNIEASMKQIESAQAGVEVSRNSILQAQSAAAQIVSVIEKNKAEYERQQDLLPKKATSLKALQRAQAMYDVSLEEKKMAAAAIRQAEANLLKSQAALAEAQARLGALGDANPQLRLAIATVRQSELNLEFTKIHAPTDGYIANLRLRLGSHVVANQPTLALVDTASYWVDGFFKENQLDGIEAGDRAVVTLMSYPDRPLSGVVDSVGWGISQKDGSTGVDLLPQISATFEWIRLAQRIPVKVRLADVPKDVKLRVGTTCSVAVRGSERNGNAGLELSEDAPVKSVNRFVSLVAALGCLTSGCVTVGPNYRPAPVNVAPQWQEFEDPSLAATSPVVPLWWKEAFKDPVLDQLVDEALANNLTLRSASLRVLQARQQLLIVANLRLPQEQYLGASAAVVDPGVSGGASGAYSAAFNFNWTLDVWGRIRRQVESASAVYDGTLSSYDGVVVLVIGQVAQTYLLIRTTEQRLAASTRNLAYQTESVRISEAKLEAGETSSLDVEQGLTLLYNTQASVALLEQSLQQLKVSLALLLGQPPQDLTQRLGPSRPVPALSPLVALGMPQDLIRRRPDIRVAERRVAAQSAQIGVAVSDLYPSLGLRGSIGPSVSTATEGQDFVDLFKLENIGFSLGGLLRWNLFNWGRLRENVRLQDAAVQQAIEDYRQVVIQAQGEVELALIAYFKSLQQLAALQQAADAAQRSVDVATEQYQDGLVDYNTVVSTLRALVGQQDQLASVQGSVAVNLVGVYLSLGGGWELRKSSNAVDLIPEKTKEEMRARGKYWPPPPKDK